MQGIAMNQAIYDYLLGELYPLPQCDTCQYSDPRIKRIPCNQCEGFSKYKLHKGHEADLKQLTKGIIKIVKNKTKWNSTNTRKKP